MYLKKMEIVGFKSFADRTKVEFDQGVTAIVGPNGSGKSNIVEALRWVLGEQSAKSLRGGKMPDVIFSGTEKRHAMNFAQVTAYFDNTDHYLASSKDNEDVIISRQLYRNGDAEFRLNGKKCRLRDIHDLFLDTGLGRDSLSIISQGRIEAVFNSKAEDRRAIFEEAAGVLKFKSRRNETESKLSTTQDNLDRLEDILYELKGQLVPLEAQKTVALRFQTLDAKEKALDLSVLMGQLIAEKEKYDTTNTALIEISQALLKLSDHKKTYDEQWESLRFARTKVETQQEALQKETLQLTELKSEVTRKIELFDVQKNSSQQSTKERKQHLSELNEKLSVLTAQEKSAHEKITQLTQEKNELEQKIKKLNQKQDALSEAPELVMERLRETYVDLVNQEAQLSNTKTKNQAELEHLIQKMSERNASTKENAQRLKDMTTALNEAQNENHKLKNTIATLLKNYESEQEKEKKRAQKERLAQNEMYDQMNLLNKDKARLASLENIQETHSNLYQGVRAVMQNQSQIKGIIGVVADLLTFDPRYTTAIDIALGGGSQNIVCEDESSAKRAIAYLRERRLGRATFLPLTTIKPRNFSAYERISSMTGFIDTALALVSADKKLIPALSSLLGTTAVVDTAENATAIARQMNYTIRIVTLDGTQINPGGSYSGGAGKRNSTTFTQTEIKSLKNKIETANEQLKITEHTVAHLQQEAKENARVLTDLRAQGEEKRFDEKSLALKIDQLKENQSNLLALSALTESSQSKDRVTALQQENKILIEQLAKISQEKQTIESQLEAVKGNAQTQNDQKTHLLETLNQSKLDFSEKTSELRFVSTDENRLTREKAQVTAEIARVLDLLSPQIEYADENRHHLEKQLNTVLEKLKTANVKSVSLKFEHEDIVAQMEELEQHNHDFIEQTHALNLQKTRLDLQFEQIKARLIEKQNRLNSDFEISFESALKTTPIPEDLEQCERDLKNVSRQIKALGPVNLDAIQQFDEVNERYQFLNRQKTDLSEAKTLLLSTIDEMNDEVKARFKTTFEAIRESFKTTFSQMFVGGQADLALTSDNLLEAGVEINVQPPGKKLSSLNLMSGGEKALTALALIFAILRVRTVPFVVLDEVEAALDEVNVKRFGDYMNHFDNSNQFIVVTHRRGTMAAAKAMYGVTMADAGVSKMMSVKLDTTRE